MSRNLKRQDNRKSSEQMVTERWNLEEDIWPSTEKDPGASTMRLLIDYLVL